MYGGTVYIGGIVTQLYVPIPPLYVHIGLYRYLYVPTHIGDIYNIGPFPIFYGPIGPYMRPIWHLYGTYM